MDFRKKLIAVGIILLFVLSPILVFAGGGKPEATQGAAKKGPFVLVDIGKAKGTPYFKALFNAVAGYAKEYGDTVYNNGPVEITAEAQIEVIEATILQRPNAIFISCNDSKAVVPALQKAMKAGILVVGFDSAPAPEARDFFVSPADLIKVGAQQVEMLGAQINYTGEIGIVSAAPNMEVQNVQIEGVKEALANNPKYSKMKLVDVVYGYDEMEKSYTETVALINAHPNIKGIMSPSAVPIVAMCKVLEDKGLVGKIALTGIGLPSLMAEYVHKGVIKNFGIWAPPDLGYVAYYATRAILAGEFDYKKIGAVLKTPKMGNFTVTAAVDGGTQISLPAMRVFDASNIDEWKDVF
jgi:rhamnose transport system substrate-binding protein